jgi:protein-S-isoprenylcysteine O-methyltransferase Ste14
MKKVLAVAYGILVYVLFLGTFLYAIAFVGNLGVPTSVDRGKPASTLAAIVIDALLLGVFAVQHTIMARYGFKQRWTRVVSWYLERSTFVLAASLSLALVLWLWEPC